MEREKILVIGAQGQVGHELIEELRKIYEQENVIASDIKNNNSKNGPFEILNVLDSNQLLQVVKKHEISQVYLLAALLSATAEKNPKFGWDLNMNGLFNVLELAKEGLIKKIFWPSSIAVFGPTTPKVNTPQHTIIEPNTVYGISKFAGERWCEYYFQKYGVDVRSIRYPGLIGYKSQPGGGTTDYAVHIFYEAVNHGRYTCFLSKDTCLPMMYMPDAIRATLQIMHADAKNVRIRSSYNIAGVSFSPEELAGEIKKHIPGFEISYEPDFRQEIADNWPGSIDDEQAKRHWNWKPEFNLGKMVEDMLKSIKKSVILL